MFTSDELNLAKDRYTRGFVRIDRQLKIDRAKFSHEQVNIMFFPAA